MKSANIIRRPGEAAGTGASWLRPGIASLLVVYLVLGSTYLGLRVAVSGDGGLPPFSLGAIRLAAASLILLAWARLRGDSLALSWSSIRRLAVTAWLMWLGGNGLITWAVTRVDSGYAAMFMATIPMWAAVIEAVLERRAPRAVEVRGLALGLAGIVVLSWPRVAGGSVELVGMLALVAAPMCWAAGAVFQKRRPAQVSGVASAGYQLVFGAMGFAAVALLRGEAVSLPATEPALALGYLIVFGSVIGFACYVHALRKLPATLVMTHAYVNPVVALLLGWLILAEPLDVATWAGTGFVLMGVVTLFRRDHE